MKHRLRYSLFDNEICAKCKSCETRHEGCHGTCEDYQKGRLLMDLLQIEARKKVDAQEDIRTYEVKQIERKAKRKHPSTRYGLARKRR